MVNTNRSSLINNQNLVRLRLAISCERAYNMQHQFDEDSASSMYICCDVHLCDHDLSVSVGTTRCCVFCLSADKRSTQRTYNVSINADAD